MTETTILHLDMDAFFASVEQRDDPALRNRPVAVVGSHRRTVLVSPSYKARAYGVKTGMTKSEARSLCPDIVFIKADTDKYAQACNNIITVIYAFSPDIEVYSIDEFFIDITHTLHLFGSPEYIAARIKEKICVDIGLSCSIGIAHNKLLAKFASEKCKPGGIYRVKKEAVAALLEEVECGTLWGIGRKTEQALQELGIYTLGQLQRCSVSVLRNRFGVNGNKLHLMACGIDDSRVVPIGSEEEAKSMGHSMTFDRDTADPEVLSRYLLELCDKVGRRLRKAGLCAGNIKLTIRYKSFTTFTRQKALDSWSDDTKCLYRHALFILRSIRLKEPVRLLGVSAAKLVPGGGGNSLFKEGRRKYRLNRLLDDVNERYQTSAVSFASLLIPSRHKRVISPAWRPSGKRNY